MPTSNTDSHPIGVVPIVSSPLRLREHFFHTLFKEPDLPLNRVQLLEYSLRRIPSGGGPCNFSSSSLRTFLLNASLESSTRRDPNGRECSASLEQVHPAGVKTAGCVHQRQHHLRPSGVNEFGGHSCFLDHKEAAEHKAAHSQQHYGREILQQQGEGDRRPRRQDQEYLPFMILI